MGFGKGEMKRQKQIDIQRSETMSPLSHAVMLKRERERGEERETERVILFAELMKENKVRGATCRK